MARPMSNVGGHTAHRPVPQNLNADNSCQKTGIIRSYITEALSNFTVLTSSVPNILARIVVS